jgi:shikimate dehydrogenase
VPTVRDVGEVWGSPISHSLSPVLHRAAYHVLGLSWSYHSREVDSGSLAQAWADHTDRSSGLSLTMPVKEPILALVSDRDPVVEILGVANTVYWSGGTPRLGNTDPWGVMGALGDHALAPQRPVILGAGATARAVGYGLFLMGVSGVDLVVRNVERASGCATVLRSLGLDVQIIEMSAIPLPGEWDLVVSTLPGGLRQEVPFSDELLQKASLFDVSYHPWPSEMATRWAVSPCAVVSGMWMLVHQALRQVRLFVHHDADVALPREEEVLLAMKNAVGLSSGP